MWLRCTNSVKCWMPTKSPVYLLPHILPGQVGRASIEQEQAFLQRIPHMAKIVHDNKGSFTQPHPENHKENGNPTIYSK